MKFLEDLLERKSKLENTEVYLSQWIYDKEIYKDILSSVKDYYSNYTDHGNKHSETVLNNIVRIFGKEPLEELSSLDIWLLLEAAYMHDCGMYISLENAKTILCDDNFKNYLKNIKSQTGNPLYEYSKKFELSLDGNKILYSNNEYNPELEYGMRFIIASYKRSSHAKNSNDVLGDRKFNYIIPQRIYKILTLIVEAHNFDFKDVMLIPQKESGIALELGHPRFIACLLRLGDLLDLDNNRISPTILNNLGDIIPDDSMEHLIKHRSITHYRVDNQRIEVTATIENDMSENNSYNIANITNQWFNFIEDEFNNQLLLWDEIKPTNFKGYLPTIGELNVNLVGFDFINSKETPRFSVDINNILGLLSGGGIYKNKETAMRELIQNAIDATLIKTYEETQEKESLFEKTDIYSRKPLFENKKIKININKKKSDHIYNYWEISVKDKGVGLNKEKLKYVIEAGSSYKDREKNVQIDKMPQWMQPSGNFGIGFQSVFLLTDKVNIKSKDLYKNTSIEATLFSPTSKLKNRGSIFIKTLPFDYKEKIGTEISFIYKTIKNSTTYSLGAKNRQFTRQYIKNFDPFLQDEFDIEIAYLIDEIIEVNSYSLIDVELFYDTKKLDLKKDDFKEMGMKFLEEYKMEISIPESYNNDFFLNSNPIFYYKNQRVNHDNLEINNLNMIINIVGYKASETLEVNRDKIKSSFISENKESIIFAIFKYIKNELEPKITKLNKIFLLRISLFLNSNKYYYENYLKIIDSNEKKISDEIFDYYKKFNFGDENHWNFSSISKEDKIKINFFNIEDPYKQKIIKLNENQINFAKNQLIKLLFDQGNYYKVEFLEENKESFNIILTKVKTKKDELLEINYKELFSQKNLIKHLNKRFYIPYNGKFPKLKLIYPMNFEEESNYLWIGDYFINSYFHYIYNFYWKNKILFPFYLKEISENKYGYIWNSEIRKKYIDFQYKYRADISLNRNELEIEVDNFVKELKVILKDFKQIEDL